MSDLIDRQAAIEAIDAVFPVDPMKSEYAQGIACGAALAKTYVEQLPPAQPEIIRCKDCKYCVYTPATPNANRQSEGHNPERWNCYLYLHEHHPAITPNDFCSYGERRTE